MTDDLLRLAREAGLAAATRNDILEALRRDPFEDVPAEVWQEFTRAAALLSLLDEVAADSAEDDRE